MSQEVEDEEEAKEGEESKIEEVEDEDEKPKEKTKEKEVLNEELNKMKPIWTQPWGYHTGGVRHILQEFDQRMGGPPSSTSSLKASLNSLCFQTVCCI
jgi:hypothetical protein